ncbi:alcohol dehydrogenase catalytic domain-containing protein [Paraburkholderia sediminicola]|uniref:alcohol dehydrogenase catalytic domain-containing protein n=1 Tax=Paraburkholderia sediminicola TaxID=458836 RepID=UPI0038B7FF54
MPRGQAGDLLGLKGARKFRLVPGNDFAGEIVSVGAGVSSSRPGDRVMRLVHR